MTPYPRNETALLFIDPYNDLLSVGGKLWPYVERVAVEVGSIDSLRKVTQAVRDAGIQVFARGFANTDLDFSIGSACAPPTSSTAQPSRMPS